jgi:glycosyltransferase involved in cell wall biosynthesis
MAGTTKSGQSVRQSQRGCAIIPAYKEAGRIGGVVRRTLEFLPDVVVVDDGSGDATADEAREAGAVVLKLATNKGKGAALAEGFAHAKSKGFAWVITLDADGQHDPADIPKFVEAYVRTGIPVLVGNRMGDTATMPRVRRLTNTFMSNLLSREMGQYVPDTQCGYRLYRTDVLPFLATQSTRFAAESESLLHVAERGLSIGAVPIAVIYLEGRESHIRPFRDSMRFFSMLMDYRRTRRRPPAA